MTYEEWLRIGQERGFCGPVICVSHHPTFTPEEEERFEQGFDPCVWAVRVDDGSLIERSVLIA